MSEFVEQSGNFVKCEQRRFGSRWSGKVTHDGNMWSFVFIVLYILRFERSHPSTVSLTFSREKVCVKQSQIRTILVENTESLHFWMINIYIINRSKCDSV